MSAPELHHDGLALLSNERPDVLDAYLHLLGRLGGALDPKARQLILLSLQVVQGSARAIRHHVPRARAAGATSAEMMDAILLALPVAGLTKVSEALAEFESLSAGPT